MKQKIWTAEQRPPGPGPVESGLGPVELLESLMRKRKLRAVDLAADLEISESHLSDIRRYRRALSKEVIRKLAARFEVGQERFNRPYKLVAQRKIEKPPGRAGQQQQNPARKKGRRDTALLELLQLRTGMPTIARMKDGSSLTIWNFMWSYFFGDEYAYITTNSKPVIEGENIDICFTSDIAELIDPATGNNLYCG
jgi:plasmid maintenance system antidote protein VapI